MTEPIFKDEDRYIKENKLPGIPEMDECGKCAMHLFLVLQDIEECAKRKRDAMEALIKALTKEKRVSIKFKNKTFVLEHLQEAFVIKVRK